MSQSATQIEKRKKHIVTAAAAAAVIILLLIALWLIFPPSKQGRQEDTPGDGGSPSETGCVISDTNTVTAATPASTKETITEEASREASSDRTDATGTDAPKETEDASSQGTETVTSRETEPVTSKETDAVTSRETETAVTSVASGPEIKVEPEQKTGYEPLDTMTRKILSGIINPGMTPREKLYAIYNYVKKNMHYDMSAPSVDGVYDSLISLGYHDYDSRQIALAYDAATYLHGVCDHYAALTMILARAAGIPLFQSGGLSHTGTSHAWNILFIDGEKYLVDTNYGFFMKRFAESGFTEQMDGKSFFNSFRTETPPAEETKIAWMFNAGFGNQRFFGNDRGEITVDAAIARPLYSNPPGIYPEPITPTLTSEGESNSFSATVSVGGNVIETLKEQSGSGQMYYFSWYPPSPGSYVIEITVVSDGIFTGHFIITANITD